MRILFLLLFVAFGAAAADVKITALPTTNVVHTVDIFPLVTQPGGASATTMSATLGVLATSLSRDQGMITNNYSPTFNNITGTNLSMYGSAGGTIKLYDASGNGPYAQLGTNDNLALSNSASAMTVTITNGGANFGSNVVAKHFYGDGSTLTGVGGGSGTVSNAAALTSGQLIIGGGSGAVSALAIDTQIGAVPRSDGATPYYSDISNFIKDEQEFIGATVPGGWQSSGTLNWGFTTFPAQNRWGVARLRYTSAGASVNGGIASCLLGAGVCYFELATKMDNLSDGTDSITEVAGLGDQTGIAIPYSNGVFFRFSQAVDSQKWQCVTCSNGTETVTSSGVASSTSWVKLACKITDNTQALFYINGSVVATNTANIPTNAAIGQVLTMAKTAGSTERNHYIDYFNVYFKPTVTR